MTYSDDLPLFSDPPQEGADLRHVLLPNIAWACGGNIVTKGGHITFLNEWDKVTCPDCLAFGQEALVEETRRQQGKVER